MACFDDLDDDVLHTILDHLCSERLSVLSCLRSVSRRFTVFAESVLYRTVVLEEDNVIQELATYRCIERLLEPSDTLRQHVRFMHVRSFKGDDDSLCMNMRLLVACLLSIRKLDTFSWDIDLPLPGTILTALHQHHPFAQICVSLKQLDQAVVSSAQLHRLSFSIPCSDILMPKSVAPLKQLRDVLLQSPTIRAFTVDAHLDVNLRQAAERVDKEKATGVQYFTGKVYNEPWARTPHDVAACDELSDMDPVNKIQIPLESTDWLPPLECLAIKARTYTFDYEHCINLQRCMDWTSLKQLTLGSSNAEIFFEMFNNKLPQLEFLDFSYHSVSASRYPFLEPAVLVECSNFVSSLSKLKALTVRCNLINLKQAFWYELAATHGECLQSLSIQPLGDQLEAPICQGAISNLLRPFTALRTLDLATRLSPFALYSSCSDCSGPCQTKSSEYINTIPFIASLETLRISIRIFTNPDRSLHECITAHAHCVIRQLWAMYSDQPSSSNLRAFNVEFWRWKTPSPHLDGYNLGQNDFLDKIEFESTRKGRQLVVKARDHRKTIVTTYDELWRVPHAGVLEGPRVIFSARQIIRRERIFD